MNWSRNCGGDLRAVAPVDAAKMRARARVFSTDVFLELTAELSV